MSLTLTYGPGLEALVGFTFNAADSSALTYDSGTFVYGAIPGVPKAISSVTATPSGSYFAASSGISGYQITSVNSTFNEVYAQPVYSNGQLGSAVEFAVVAYSSNAVVLVQGLNLTDAMGELAGGSTSAFNSEAVVISLDGSSLGSSHVTWGGWVSPPLTMAQFASDLASHQYGLIQGVTVQDTVAKIAANLSALQSVYIGSVILTDPGTPTFNVGYAQVIDFSSVPFQSPFAIHVTDGTVKEITNYQMFRGHVTSTAIVDSALNVVTNFDALATYAGSGQITSISFTDSAVPTISISDRQLAVDSAVISAITSPSIVKVNVVNASDATLNGVAGQAAIVLSGYGSSQFYGLSANGDGVHLTITGGSVPQVASNVEAVQFSDYTAFVASQTPIAGGNISSAQVVDLYSAVLARTPDAGGLAYYENYARNNPTTPILTFAEWFLSSPEYTTNTAHNYVLNSTGDGQFITDTYSNLLHRAPESGAVQWYEANVINPIIAADTAAGATMAQAELHAHAQVLTYFSASSEFLGDVQITAQHPLGSQHWLLVL
jgi:hypothetical protein